MYELGLLKLVFDALIISRLLDVLEIPRILETLKDRLGVTVARLA